MDPTDYSLGDLFSGRQDCFGRYYLSGDKPSPGKKREGKAVSYPNSKHPKIELTPEEYEAHEKGLYALGIVPVSIDGTCKWFSIDVDKYDLNHTDLAKQISAKQLPIIHCRSKSGGAHLYGMLSGAWSAKNCIALARKWVELLGFDLRKTEVFPKQTKFDGPEAKGNWIIIPYYGGKKAEDFGIDEAGHRIPYEDFPQYCISRKMTPKEAQQLLDQKETHTWSQDEILDESPPCVRSMMEQSIKEGDGRNNALSHLSWYYKKLDDFFETSDWKDKLDEFNNTYFDPPVSHRELSQIIKNHQNGKYKARCEANPMCNICDKAACLKRKFGIGDSNNFYGEIEMTGATKIETGDDPLWKMYINGQSIILDTADLLSPRKFKIAVMAKTNIIIESMKQKQHDEMIAKIIKSALVVEAADIVSNASKVYECYKQWISLTGGKSTGMEALLRGLPYIDYKQNAIYLRLQDVVLEYRRVHKENLDDKEIYLCLKSQGLAVEHREINGAKHKFLAHHYDDDDATWVPEKKTEGQF